MTCRTRSKARYKLCDRSPFSHSFALLLLSPPYIETLYRMDSFLGLVFLHQTKGNLRKHILGLFPVQHF